MAKKPDKDLLKAPKEADGTSYMFEQLEDASDHAAVLLGCELLFHAVGNCIKREMKASASVAIDETLGENGVLRSFWPRIVLGQALGCFGPLVREELDCLRWIRNRFAHAKLRIDFNTPPIKERCLKLETYKRLRGMHEGRYASTIELTAKLQPDRLARVLFLQTVTMLSTALLKDAERHYLEPSAFIDVLDLPDLHEIEIDLRRRLISAQVQLRNLSGGAG